MLQRCLSQQLADTAHRHASASAEWAHPVVAH
jgi:hypothetical protein